MIRDLTTAYTWFTLAARAGNEDAEANRATIVVTLTANEIARAGAMAKRWLETYEWEIEAGSFGG